MRREDLLGVLGTAQVGEGLDGAFAQGRVLALQGHEELLAEAFVGDTGHGVEDGLAKRLVGS